MTARLTALLLGLLTLALFAGLFSASPTAAQSPPSAPMLAFADVGDGTLTVSWISIGATKHELAYSSDNGSSWTTYSSNLSGAIVTISTNDNTKTYVARVRAGNDGGWSGWTHSNSAGPYYTTAPPPAAAVPQLDEQSQKNLESAQKAAKITQPGLPHGQSTAALATTAPAAPAGLSVTPSEGYLDISWNAVGGASGYDLRAKTAGSSSWHEVATNISTTSHRYTTSQTIDYVAVRARNGGGTSAWTEKSRLPSNAWLNTVQTAQSSGASSAGASIASGGSIAAQLSAPTWGTITRGYDAGRRSDRIDVNWTGDSNATGYNLVCAVAWGASPGWNWHPCGWVDSTTGTVKFTTVPANASQPVGIVSYKRGSESRLSPGIIPLDGTDARSYAVAIRSASATPSEASTWVATASIRPLNPELSNLTWTRTDGQIALSWTPNPWTTGYEIDCDTYDSTQSPYSPSYTRCATLTNQDHSASQHSVTISTWPAGGTNYAIDNTSTYDIKICSTNTWNNACHLAPLIAPNPSLTVSNVARTTATLTIGGHTGNWYYKHTGAGAACEGPVSTTSKALTGLTTNTPYTYSAYSDSTCSTLLAAATPFTTGSSISNLSNTKGSGPTPVERGKDWAMAFSTGSNVSGYILKTSTLALRNVSATSSNLVVTLHQMEGTGEYGTGSRPSATVLATLSGTAPTSATFADTTYTCSGDGCQLSPNTTYFVHLDYEGSGQYDWAYSDSSAETRHPGDNGWDLLNSHREAGGSWDGFTTPQLVELLFVNVPSPELAASNLATTTATLSIAHHADAWYYKATSGPHTTCQGPVTAGTSSTDISGLTAGTSYTYSAYSDSSCATLLATAAEFTTLSSVSNLGSNGGNGNPSYIFMESTQAVAFTTGPNSSGYTLKSATFPLKRVGSPSSPITATLHAMEGTGQYSTTSAPSDTVLATLSGTSPASSTFADTAYTCSGSGCALSPNTTYFVVLASAASGSDYYQWDYATTETEIAQPSGNGWGIGFAHLNLSTERQWKTQTPADFNLAAFSFANNPTLTSSNVAATAATLTIAHHSGDWYYKHTNTGATCDGPVSGTSQNLTGLTAGTAYTYSAYSDSSCTTGNLLATAAQFTTLIDKASVSNLDETASSLLIIGSSGTGSAHTQEFTTGNTTGVYQLTSFTVDFAAVINAGAVTVAIHDRQSDGTPSATARAMTLSGTVANGQAEFTCSNNCELDANTSYFISVSASAANAAYLNSTTSDAQTLVPTGTGWSIADAARRQSGIGWPELSSGQSMRIKVEATLEAKLTSSSITATTATLTIGGHTGQWWYKANTGPDATCQGPVAAGTSSVNLTGLTTGTSYTYTAYDKAACNSVDLIATAPQFSTP